MQNKKIFTKGCLFGAIFIIALNLLVTNVDKTYRRFISKDLTINQKLKEIDYIVDKYSVNEFNQKNKLEGMYVGLLSTLNDVYSSYMPKEIFDKFIQDTEGNYVGIGIILSYNENKIKVSKVFDNSPAHISGILPNDEILKINDEKVSIENFENITSKIKGAEGTKVKLTIYRQSQAKTIDFDVVRKSIEVPTVSYKLLQDNIGYISISQFDRVTANQFKEALKYLEKNSAKGLILDLRDNPGGLLTTVCEIADLLVPEGIITYIEDKNGKRSYEYSKKEYYNKPLVLLVNQNSASASEVLSGAIKDYGVGSLVGETTYGKGVVQNIFKLSDGSGIKVTIAKYFTPNGISIDGVGVEPDYFIKNDEFSAQDLQLNKGIEIIKQKIK